MKKSLIIAIGIVVVAGVVAAGIVFMPKRASAPVAQQKNNNQVAAVVATIPPAKMAPIPQGSQTFQVMQAPGVMPKIDQVTINPVNADPGNTQTLTVVISDPNSITSVVATTRTDNGTTTIPLTIVGPVTVSGTVAQKYSAHWTVKDTHVARYTTIFTATDAKGNTNSATMNWTDTQCSFNGTNNFNGGTWDAHTAYPSGCSFAANQTDGVENGTATIDAPITLQAGSAFVITSGHMTISGAGQITIAPSAKIALGGDMYCASTTWVTSFSNPADGTYQVSRSALNNNVFPQQNAYFTTAVTTNYGTTTFNYNCGATLNYQYTSSQIGNITQPGGCSGPSTCNTPQYTQGYFPYTCGSALQHVVDEGNVAVCLNNGNPSGYTCDVVTEGSAGSSQGCN